MCISTEHKKKVSIKKMKPVAFGVWQLGWAELTATAPTKLWWFLHLSWSPELETCDIGSRRDSHVSFGVANSSLAATFNHSNFNDWKFIRSLSFVWMQTVMKQAGCLERLQFALWGLARRPKTYKRACLLQKILLHEIALPSVDTSFSAASEWKKKCQDSSLLSNLTPEFQSWLLQV